jgi:predicted dehydrogenase
MYKNDAPLSVLIIGGGNIAGRFDEGQESRKLPMTHAGAYTAHAGFSLKAIVESDPVRRRAFSDYWNISIDAAEIAELNIESGHFDVISICSPTALHITHLTMAINLRPKAIFCEKPVASNLADAKIAVKAAHEAGILLAVNHTRRWSPDMRRLAHEIASGHWGSVRSAIGYYNKGILNNGTHLIDLLTLLLGKLEVEWVGHPINDFWPNDPSIPAVLRTDSGTLIHLCTGHAVDYAMFELTIVTEKAVISVEDGGFRWRVRQPAESLRFPGYQTLDSGVCAEGEYPHAMMEAINNLYDAVLKGSQLACDGHQALVTQALAESILEKSMQLHPTPQIKEIDFGHR